MDNGLLLSFRHGELGSKGLGKLRTLAEAVSSAAKLRKFLDLAGFLIVDTLRTDLSLIEQMEPTGKTLVCRAGVGWSKELDTLSGREIVAGSQAFYIMQHGSPVLLLNLSKGETRFRPWSPLLDYGVVSGVCVPMLLNGQPAGIISTYSRHKRSFRWRDIFYLESLADVVGYAYELSGVQLGRWNWEPQNRRLP